MTKALRSMNAEDRKKAIARRIRGKTGGLGYLSAVAAQQKMGEKSEVPDSPSVAEEAVVEVDE